MGLRERLLRWLSRGDVEPIDGDAMVELTEVMLHDGPMLVAALERAGIPARGVEAWDFVTKSGTRMRIWVRAADLGRASAVMHGTGIRLGRRTL
jgi:hypothetical protein